MSARLDGKRCLITGAGSGIGRAAALAFAQEGAEVVASDINGETLASLCDEHPSIRSMLLDVSRIEKVETMASHDFEVLFNCAGYVHAGSALETDEASWRRSFAINVDAMFYLCKAVLPGMLQRGQGSIINMASVVSSVKGAPNRFAYGASKAAVIGLTKAIAADFVTKGIRCNAICPGTVKTPSLTERVAALGGDQATVWKIFAGRQPMGRLGEATEIAALAVYLASDESSFTTGAVHIIDGGWSI